MTPITPYLPFHLKVQQPRIGCVRFNDHVQVKGSGSAARAGGHDSRVDVGGSLARLANIVTRVCWSVSNQQIRTEGGDAIGAGS